MPRLHGLCMLPEAALRQPGRNPGDIEPLKRTAIAAVLSFAASKRAVKAVGRPMNPAGASSLPAPSDVSVPPAGMGCGAGLPVATELP